MEFEETGNIVEYLIVPPDYTDADLMVKIIKTFDMTQPQLMFQFCGTDNKSIHFSEWCANMMIHSHIGCHHIPVLKTLAIYRAYWVWDNATNWKAFGYQDCFRWKEKPPRVVKTEFLSKHSQKQREFMNALGKKIAMMLYAARETDPWIISRAQRTPLEQALGHTFEYHHAHHDVDYDQNA
eukprot:COSAG05_NODE_33_length_28089_cov_31.909289_24_plen_181_part_00